MTLAAITRPNLLIVTQEIVSIEREQGSTNADHAVGGEFSYVDIGHKQLQHYTLQQLYITIMRETNVCYYHNMTPPLVGTSQSIRYIYCNSS